MVSKERILRYFVADGPILEILWPMNPSSSPPVPLAATPIPTTAATHPDYTTLRDLVASWIPAAGPIGFEGLVAQALSAITGLTFRLARSGSQFGRDAATPMAPFAIAMEAKRYQDSIPLQELVGKSGLAGFALDGRVDLWVLAATVEVGEATARAIEEILDHHGITTLLLDCANTGLPRLLTLLTATADGILPWIESHRGQNVRHQFEAEFARVRADGRFSNATLELKDALAPATVGLDALRREAGRWADEGLANRSASQIAFSQFVTPLDTAAPAVSRPSRAPVRRS